MAFEQIAEFLGIYEEHGDKYLEDYQPRMLSWEEVKALKEEKEGEPWPSQPISPLPVRQPHAVKQSPWAPGSSGPLACIARWHCYSPLVPGN